MLEFSKRIGICLVIATAFCMASCGDDDSSTDKGKSGGGDSGIVTCEGDSDCADVDGKPVCDTEKKECVAKSEDGGNGGDGGNGDGGNGDGGNGDGGNGDSGNGDGGNGDGGNGGEETKKDCSAEGKTECGGECVDTSSDSMNCGKCGEICGSFSNCVSGSCVFSCPEGHDGCGGTTTCFDLQNDAENCGTCGNACPENSSCANGKCGAIDCGELTNCSDVCVDKTSNAANCGECGHACDPGQVCESSACIYKCSSAQTKCGDGMCYNTKSDATHCGDDCTKCNEGQVCNDGRCMSECKDEHCTCDEGKACKVADGYACVDETSVKTCGCSLEAEGTNCENMEHVETVSCTEGACVYDACSAGFDNCDENVANGCETDLGSDDNCGACGKSCKTDHASSATCNAGTCNIVCEDGYSLCNGSCVNADTMKEDVKNCGYCGNTCGEGQVCSNGFCQVKKCNGDYVSVEVETMTGKKTVQAYCVTDQNELVELQQYVEGGRKYPSDRTDNDNAFILMKDIEIIGSEWKPIGSENHKFTGIFLGNGHKVTSSSAIKGGRNTGLFGVVDGATLDGFDLAYNVEVLEWATTWSDNKAVPADAITRFISYANTGGLAANVTNSVISRNRSKIDVKGFTYLGELVGLAKKSKFHHNEVSGKVNGSKQNIYYVSIDSNLKRAYAGGIVGYCEECTIENCDSTSIMYSGIMWDYLGGIAGWVKDTSIKDCKSSAVHTFYSNHGGGLVGVAENSTIDSCNAYIKISTAWWKGGILGGLASSINQTTVKNSFAEIEATTGGYMNAGFIAQISNKSVIENCVVKAKMHGHYNAGFAYSIANSTVDGVKIDHQVTGNPSPYYAGSGAFINVSGSTIKNVSVLTTMSKNNSVAGFVVTASKSSFENCYVTGSLTSTEDHAAGFVVNSGDSTFTNCVSYAMVSGKKSVGGFVANLTNNATITNCYATGDVTGGESAGSFAGKVSSGSHSVSHSYGLGRVSGETNVGGIVGHVAADTTYYMERVYWWNGACNTSPCNTGVGKKEGFIPNNAVYASFELTGFNEPVLEGNADLVNALNDDGDSSDWVTSKCMLDYGSGAIEYKIPVLKNLKPSFCE